jgi:uncharacterized protein YutE (UPF0331/DUF86 family)
LDELYERLARLTPLRSRPQTEFMSDPYLRDIVERNLEVAAQCCIDICHRIIALEGAQKPSSYYEAILRMGELGIVSPAFARRLAPIAGLRNILVHEYLTVDWNEVYASLAKLDDLAHFADLIRTWLSNRSSINP